MNLKNIIFIIIGIVVFIAIWLFSMIGGICILIGFGFGIWWHDWLKNIYRVFQTNIYLEQKSEREQRKKQLELELEKLKEG